MHLFNSFEHKYIQDNKIYIITYKSKTRIASNQFYFGGHNTEYKYFNNNIN